MVFGLTQTQAHIINALIRRCEMRITSLDSAEKALKIILDNGQLGIRYILLVRYKHGAVKVDKRHETVVDTSKISVESMLYHVPSYDLKKGDTADVFYRVSKGSDIDYSESDILYAFSNIVNVRHSK